MWRVSRRAARRASMFSYDLSSAGGSWRESSTGPIVVVPRVAGRGFSFPLSFALSLRVGVLVLRFLKLPFLCISSSGICRPLPRFLISFGRLRLGLQCGSSTLDVVLCDGLRRCEKLPLRAVGQPGVCREVHLFCPEVGVPEKFPEQRLPGIFWVPHCGCFPTQSDFHLRRDLQPQHVLWAG